MVPDVGTQITVFREGTGRAIRAVVTDDKGRLQASARQRYNVPEGHSFADENGEIWFPYKLVDDIRTPRKQASDPRTNHGGGHRSVAQQGITWALGWGAEIEAEINAAYTLWKAGQP